MIREAGDLDESVMIESTWSLVPTKLHILDHANPWRCANLLWRPQALPALLGYSTDLHHFGSGFSQYVCHVFEFDHFLTFWLVRSFSSGPVWNPSNMTRGVSTPTVCCKTIADAERLRYWTSNWSFWAMQAGRITDWGLSGEIHWRKEITGVFICCYFVLSVFICLFVYLFICLFIYLFVCLFVCFFVSLFICLFIYLFVCFFVYLFLCLFVYLFISISISLHIYIYIYLFNAPSCALQAVWLAWQLVRLSVRTDRIQKVSVKRKNQGGREGKW